MIFSQNETIQEETEKQEEKNPKKTWLYLFYFLVFAISRTLVGLKMEGYVSDVIKKKALRSKAESYDEETL